MSPRLQETLRARLAHLAENRILRVQRVSHVSDDEQVLCSNDYLGLASDGSLMQAPLPSHARRSGSGASRLISGTHEAHVALEEELAAWLGTEAAITFATGYQANVGLLSALAQEGDVIFSDSLNHASIIDGIRLSRASRVVYPHLDLAVLERALEETPVDGLRIIVTDAVFSMDGDAAPLRALAALKRRYDAVLIVDEAHALGVLGPGGRGLAAELGVLDDVDAIVGPCGKAFGTTGAFVAGGALLREWLYNRARSFVFSTAPPPWSAELTRRAIPVLEAGERQEALRARMKHFAARLEAQGFWSGEPISPIFPVVVGEEAHALALAEALGKGGIFVHPIRPPTVPAGSARLRVTVTALTSYETLDHFVEILVAACDELAIRPRRWSHGELEG